MPIYQLRDSERELRVFRSLPFSEHFVERDLETWLEKNPGVLVEDEPLMVIGRQVQTSVGVIDLLALDTDGTVVVAELKRAPSQREAVSQSLEYAAWIAEQDPESLRSEAVRYLRKQRADDSFDAAWKRTFSNAPPDSLLNAEPRVFVVIEGDDARMFSMASFLRRCGVEITLLTYNFYRTDGGEQLLEMRTRVGFSDAEPTRTRSSGHFEEADVTTKWSALGQETYVAFKEELLHAGLHVRVKKTAVSFHLQTRDEPVFVCMFYESGSQAVLWLRSDSLRARIDFDKAVATLRGTLGNDFNLNATATWFHIKFPPSVERARTAARAVVSTICAALK